MIVPDTYKILCRILFGRYESYQALRLSDYNNLIKRLPNGARIDALSYLPNFTYGWSSINNISECPVSIHKGMTSVRNLFFDIPSSVRLVRPVILPDNFFKSRSLDKIEFFSNLVLINKVKDYFIETKYATKEKRKSINLNEYFRKEYIEHFNTKIFLNRREFDWKYFINEQDDIYFDYLSNFQSDLTSIYKYHVMLMNGYLTSLILLADHEKEKSLIRNNELIVPSHTYWISQLLFAKNTSVKIKFANDISFDFAVEKLKIRKIYTKINGIDISIGNKGASPIFINGGAAMRFIE